MNTFSCYSKISTLASYMLQLYQFWNTLISGLSVVYGPS
ncbi:hypothetical protein LINGRAHAP2_LOCUS11198, partial [Linum grandiflorum]